MLKLTQAHAKVTNINLRTEKNGGDKERPAADIKIAVNVHNTQLDQISPGLLNSLYLKPNEKGHQSEIDAGEDAMTTLRHPNAKPWASKEDWPGYTLLIEMGEFDKRVVNLDLTTLKGVTCEPQTGGTVKLSFSIGCHPSGEQVGWLYDHGGKSVDVSLMPPSVMDLESLRAQAKNKKKGGDIDEDEDFDEEEEVDQDNAAQFGRAFPEEDVIDGRSEKSKRNRYN